MLKNIRFQKTCPPVGRARAESGQSTVEYIILVTAVIGAIIIFMVKPGNIFQTKVVNTFNQATQDMEDKGAALANTHYTPLGNTTDNSLVTVNVTNRLF